LPWLTNSRSISQIDHRSEQALFSRQQPHPRGDDRERITKARQEAEALFAPKHPVSERSFPPLTPAEQSVRQPRILRTLTRPQVRHDQVEAPVERMVPEIPTSQFARIRTWVKYGMTAAQVAGVYGVAVGVIERILRQG
jgi:hypothetical protein